MADNVDFSVNARIQTKPHSNEYAILDRVANSLDDSRPKAALSGLQPNTLLLPTQEVQNAIKEDCVILVFANHYHLPQGFPTFEKCSGG